MALAKGNTESERMCTRTCVHEPLHAHGMGFIGTNRGIKGSCCTETEASSTFAAYVTNSTFIESLDQVHQHGTSLERNEQSRRDPAARNQSAARYPGHCTHRQFAVEMQHSQCLQDENPVTVTELH